MITKNKKIRALANLMSKYQKKWVALDASGFKIIASGKTIKEVETNLQKNNKKASGLSYVNEFGGYLSPNAHI